MPCALEPAHLIAYLRKGVMKVVDRSWSLTNKLVGMSNKSYPPCLGALFKSDVESAVSTFSNYKKHFDSLSWDQIQGHRHSSPLDFCTGGSRHLPGSHAPHKDLIQSHMVQE